MRDGPQRWPLRVACVPSLVVQKPMRAASILCAVRRPLLLVPLALLLLVPLGAEGLQDPGTSSISEM
jgi:hypothetical protein